VTGADPRAGQEAARLVAAAQDWLRTSAPHLAPLADDGQPCSCPVCRAVAGLREADPDSVGRWVDSAVAAFGSLVAQAGDLAATRTDGGDRPAGPDAGAADDEGYDREAPASAEQDPQAEGPQQGGAARRVRHITLEPAADDPGRVDR
jgi:hypothetical protein